MMKAIGNKAQTICFMWLKTLRTKIAHGPTSMRPAHMQSAKNKTILGLFMLCALSLFIPAEFISAQTINPSDCSATNSPTFIVQGLDSEWRVMDLVTGETVATYQDDYADGLNGIGYNEDDGQIWGYALDGSVPGTIFSTPGDTNADTIYEITTYDIVGLPNSNLVTGDISGGSL